MIYSYRTLGLSSLKCGRSAVSDTPTDGCLCCLSAPIPVHLRFVELPLLSVYNNFEELLSTAQIIICIKADVPN